MRGGVRTRWRGWGWRCVGRDACAEQCGPGGDGRVSRKERDQGPGTGDWRRGAGCGGIRCPVLGLGGRHCAWVAAAEGTGGRIKVLGEGNLEPEDEAALWAIGAQSCLRLAVDLGTTCPAPALEISV